jgi:hypothetical protein
MLQSLKASPDSREAGVRIGDRDGNDPTHLPLSAWHGAPGL